MYKKVMYKKQDKNKKPIQIPDALYSIDIERAALSCLLKFSHALFAEVDSLINLDCFYHKIHKYIYDIIKYNFNINKEQLTPLLLSQKLIDIKINSFGDISISEYCQTLFYDATGTFDAGKKYCQELQKLYIRRKLYISAVEVGNYILDNGRESIEQIIAQSDQIYHEVIDHFRPEKAPEDLYAEIDILINTPVVEEEATGLMTEYEHFNNWFGGVRAKNGIYAIASRPGQGKSTWLLSMANGLVRKNKDTTVLYLDTEMTTDVSKFRLLSAMTQVPVWWLETGKWKNNAEYAQKINDQLSKLKEMENKVFHLKVANKPIQQICSIVKRWYYLNKDQIKNLVVVYDYIKLTGEKLFANWSEYQAIGEKVDYLNEMGEQLNIPIWAAIQLNRSAEGGGDDNSSQLAISDRVQWFGAFVAIFRRKNAEELEEEGNRFGTHKLIPLKTRFQGQGAQGHQDFINVSEPGKKPRYIRNYINYNVNNFGVEERETAEEVINIRNLEIDIEEENRDNVEL